MTPELRKEASELQLHKRGIRINVQLHVIEADEEVRLRSADELRARLIALWAVSQAATHDKRRQVYDFLQTQQLADILSPCEIHFLKADNVTTEEQQGFRDRLHAFHFLSWCAGYLAHIDLSNKPIDSQKILQRFPSIGDDDILNANKLMEHHDLKVRRKVQIMDWCDLLYRLHWAVRHASLNHKVSPGNIDPTMVREWHQAVNWMCNYDDEDDWDQVSTETTA